jgi:hypothetical protein
VDSCPCVLEILDTAGTEPLKGQLIKLYISFQEIEVDSCPCVLEILDTAGTEQLKGQLIKLCLFSGNRGGQLSMRAGNSGHSWNGTVREHAGSLHQEWTGLCRCLLTHQSSDLPGDDIINF